MSLANFSESYESHKNRKEAKAEEPAVKADIEAYRLMKDSIETAAYVAKENLKLAHPEVLKLFEASENEHDGEAFDALLEFKSKDPLVWKQIQTLFLDKQMHQVEEAIGSYIGAIHQAERYKKDTEGESSVDVKDVLESMDKNRTAAHNALIDHLRSVGRMSGELGIDNSWLSVVGFRMGNEYRREVQRWAEHVSDYLVTVSETTH